MKVFVSYSIIDRELHLITLLVSKLKQQGYTVYLSDHGFSSQNSYIALSDTFIGIVTNHSDSIDQVFDEYHYAESLPIKTILLIEKGVQVNDPKLDYFAFERSNPQKAINELFGISDNSSQQNQSKKDDLSGVIVAGVIIAGLAALISLFAGESKKDR